MSPPRDPGPSGGAFTLANPFEDPLRFYGRGYVCRVCGCTDERACEGGCDWAEPNLCTNCLEAPPPPLTLAQAAWALFWIALVAGLCGGAWFWIAETGRLVLESSTHG